MIMSSKEAIVPKSTRLPLWDFFLPQGCNTSFYCFLRKSFLKKYMRYTLNHHRNTISGSHFAYIPYSTWPGDYSEDQWFNTSRISNLPSYNKTMLKSHLVDVVKKDPDTAFERSKRIYQDVVEKFFASFFWTCLFVFRLHKWRVNLNS